MYLAVMEENTRKNNAFTLAEVVSGQRISQNRAWRFDNVRILHILLIGPAGDELTEAQKAAVRIACNIQFGPGKVVVL